MGVKALIANLHGDDWRLGVQTIQKSKPRLYEITPGNIGQVSKLVSAGKANLEVVVYPWGVELALASPCCALKELEGSGDAV